MTTTSLPTPSVRRPTPTPSGPDDGLTSTDARNRSVCGSCAACPRAALGAGRTEKV